MIGSLGFRRMKNPSRLTRKRSALHAVELDTGPHNVHRRNKNPKIVASNIRVRNSKIKTNRKTKTGNLEFHRMKSLPRVKKRRSALHAAESDTGHHNVHRRNKPPKAVVKNIRRKMGKIKVIFRGNLIPQ